MESKIRTSEVPCEISPIPASSQEDHVRLRHILDKSTTIQELSHEEFIGLNPDEATIEDGGWPRGWRPIAAEAFRRFATKELTKEELYPNPIELL